MRSDTLKIARWEVLRNLRNKQFLIGLFLSPLMIILFMGIPRILERWDKPTQTDLYVIDHIGITDTLKQALSESNIRLHVPDIPESVDTLVYQTEAVGYIIIPANFWDEGIVRFHYNKRNNEQMNMVKAVLSQLLQQHRMERMQISPDQINWLTANAQFEETAMAQAIAPGFHSRVLSIAFLALIFFLIFTTGMMLMQSALQERRDRMAEIVLSSVRAPQLMQGKIIGHFVLGLIQLIFWIALILPAAVHFLNFPLATAIIGANLPLIIFFGLSGYLLFGSIYVSIGATMDDIQSAGNTQSMIMTIPMISFLFLPSVIRNPEGIVARFASHFPLTSPVIIIIRNAFNRIPWWEVLISATLLVISIVLIIRLAARIFRTGMLMYGKTANIGEIVKWLKYKDK